jgi:hypothetical protein
MFDFPSVNELFLNLPKSEDLVTQDSKLVAYLYGNALGLNREDFDNILRISSKRYEVSILRKAYVTCPEIEVVSFFYIKGRSPIHIKRTFYIPYQITYQESTKYFRVKPEYAREYWRGLFSNGYLPYVKES